MRIIFPNKQNNPLIHKFILSFPWIVFFCSSLSPILSFMLASVLRIPGPQFFLGLSLYGIKQAYFWQFFTYPLISSSDTIFSTSFLIKNVLISLVLRYTLKTFEIKSGSKIVFIFLISNILIIGALSWSLMTITNNFNIFFSSIFLIVSLANINISLFPNKIIRLQIPFPTIKIKWIYLATFGFLLLYYISHRNFINFGASLFSFFFSSLFCIFLKIPNPFLKDLEIQRKIKTVKIKVIKKNKN